MSRNALNSLDAKMRCKCHKSPQIQSSWIRGSLELSSIALRGWVNLLLVEKHAKGELGDVEKSHHNQEQMYFFVLFFMQN